LTIITGVPMRNLATVYITGYKIYGQHQQKKPFHKVDINIAKSGWQDSFSSL
jgi:hypothetical protein